MEDLWTLIGSYFWLIKLLNYENTISVSIVAYWVKFIMKFVLFQLDIEWKYIVNIMTVV